MSFDRGNRSRLTRHDLPRFQGTTLFDRVARALCEAECVPRKELYEAWEVARRARRRFRGGRILDLACGHALVAQLLLLVDDSSPSALAVDVKLPPSARRVSDCLTSTWPRLRGRVTFIEARIDTVVAEPDDLLVSCHACGRLTDDVLDKALLYRAKVVVLPCCQSSAKCDLGGLSGWLDPALAVDVTRVGKLRDAGYLVYTQTIPAEITPKNRLLLAEPRKSPLAAAG
ncbi:MAG TPA: methyltransferase [Polyangiaceae bacterium]|nr:methyltransferase [Polyangiaceae bacterium]